MERKSLAQRLKFGIAAGSFGLASLVLGCTEYGRAFSRGVAESMITGAAVTAASEGVKKEMGHRDYREESGMDMNGDSEQTRTNRYSQDRVHTKMIELDSGREVAEVYGEYISLLEHLGRSSKFPERGCLVSHELRGLGLASYVLTKKVEGNVIYLIRNGKERFLTIMPDNK